MSDDNVKAEKVIGLEDQFEEGCGSFLANVLRDEGELIITLARYHPTEWDEGTFLSDLVEAHDAMKEGTVMELHRNLDDGDSGYIPIGNMEFPPQPEDGFEWKLCKVKKQS